MARQPFDTPAIMKERISLERIVGECARAAEGG